MMYEKDYIMRMIAQFMAALDRLFFKNNKQQNTEDIHTQLNTLSISYLNQPFSFFKEHTIEEIRDEIINDDKIKSVVMAEIAAELIYQHTILEKDKSIQKELLLKSQNLFNYVNEHSDTFSLKRGDRMREIQEGLTQVD